ncbi:MAG: DUF488 domain-containing protein [Microbacteriaceae bacterium]
MGTIFTIGHSTHPIDEFIQILRAHGIESVIDVRTIAGSRHNPQFGEAELARSLPARGIGYRRMVELGGLRHPAKPSVNQGWRNGSFRGYADYMQTPEFGSAIQRLIESAAVSTTAIMCAEAVPWRCHRSLIGDALLVRGIEVMDIMTAKSAKPHTLTRFARVDGVNVSYPADDPLPGYLLV